MLPASAPPSFQILYH